MDGSPVVLCFIQPVCAGMRLAQGDVLADGLLLSLDLLDGGSEGGLHLLHLQQSGADHILNGLDGHGLVGVQLDGHGGQALGSGAGGQGYAGVGNGAVAVGADAHTEHAGLLVALTLVHQQGLGAVLGDQLHVLQLGGRGDDQGIAGHGGLGGVVSLDDHRQDGAIGGAQLSEGLVQLSAAQGVGIQRGSGDVVVDTLLLQGSTDGLVLGDGHVLAAGIGDELDIDHDFISFYFVAIFADYC